MNLKASPRRLLALVLSVSASVLAYVVYPGCSSFLSAPASPQALDLRHAQLYQNAMDFLETKKRAGELPGVAPRDAGTFAGGWYWSGSQHSFNRIRCRFTFADGRPAKQFEVVNHRGWQLVPLSKN